MSKIEEIKKESETALRVFTPEEASYIQSKILNIKYSQISYKMKLFWVEYREKNERKK